MSISFIIFLTFIFSLWGQASQLVYTDSLSLTSEVQCFTQAENIVSAADSVILEDH